MRIGTPFEISKEVYDRAMENRGYITSADMSELFTESQLCGYGVYSAIAYQDEVTNKYMCRFSLGDSCD